MPSFDSDGVEIAYETFGAGPPILLIHGFGSSLRINWVDTGWVETLTAAGYSVIALDNRGHGASAKLYDTEAYWPQVMAEDARRLLDRLSVPRAAVIGYSMGARITAFLALAHPERVACAVLGGMGRNLIDGLEDSGDIIAGLRAASLSDVKHPTARQFRIFADHSKSDREALAACMVTSRAPMPAADVARITTPALVAVGEADDMAGDPSLLAALLQDAEAFVIPKRTHMLATGDRAFKQAALAFLERHRGTEGW